MLFTADSHATRALTTITELLFLEAQAFGQFSINSNLSNSRLEYYVQERLSLTKFLVEVLEQHISLRFSDHPKIPYIYNTNSEHWPNHLPLAGYTNSGNQPSPSHVLTSLLMQWNLEITNHNTVSRLLTAALWIIENQSLDDAIIYLIDLIEAGYVLNTESVSIVISLLLSTRSQVTSDQEIILKLIGNQPHDSPSDWYKVEYDFDWKNAVIVPEKIQNPISTLLNKVFEKIHLVRNSNSYDEWLIGQMVVGGMVTVFQNVIQMTGQEPPLTLKRILSQFEEIRADTPTNFFATWDNYHPYTNILSAQTKGAMIIFKSKVGEGWQKQFYQERMLVPAKLQNQLLYETEKEIPDEWKYISWKVIGAFVRSHLSSDRSILMRSQYFDVETLLSSDTLQTFFLKYKITDKNQQRKILDLEYLGRIPKSWLDFKSSSSEPSYPKETIKKAISETHFELCAKELQKGQDMAFEYLKAKRYSEEITHLNHLLKLYPWSVVVYHELGIAYDEDGKHEKALEFIFPTIILDPKNPERWRSLAVILNRLGYPKEANIASGFKEIFMRQKAR